MKRPHKNFVVEYKGGTRRQPQKPTSIWGDLDLKSITRDVEADAASQGSILRTSHSVQRHEGKQAAVEPLTAVLQPSTPSLPIQGEHIAEAGDITSPTAATDFIRSPIPETKRRRGPGAKKQSLDAAASSNTAAEAGSTSGTRFEKGVRLATARSNSSRTRTATKQPRAPKPTAPANSARVIDELSVLLQLEEENKSLRRQLAEKLRVENADLRRRLGQA